MIGVVGSVWLSWGTPGFQFWAASGVCILIVAVLTFAYFVPANAAFASRSIAVDATAAKLTQWLAIHNARIGLAAIAAVLGCIAIKS